MQVQNQMLIIPDFIELVNRLETITTFAVIRFTHSLLSDYASNLDIAIISLSVALSTFAASRHSGELSNLFDCISGPATLVFIQSVVVYIKPANPGTNIALDISQYTILSISVVTFLGIIPKAFMDSPTGQRFARVVMFMYAESTSFLLAYRSLNSIIPLMTIVLISLIQLQLRKDDSVHNRVKYYTITAINIALVNLLLESTFYHDTSDGNTYLELVRSTTILVAIDYINERLKTLDNLKGYAIWKVSDYFFYIGNTYYHTKAAEVSAIAFVATLCWQLFMFNYTHTVTDLGSLVTLNGILDTIRTSFDRETKQDSPIIFGSLLLIIHIVIGLLHKKRYAD